MTETEFAAAVMAGPIVDNASERLYAIGELEYDGDEDCVRTASCERDDHTYSWPCEYAPGTGALAPGGAA